MTDPLTRLQQGLAEAMRAEDPVAAVRDLAADGELPVRWRRALERADAAGVELTEILVSNLRFSRLRNGDPEFARQFEEDPRGVAARFDRYRRQVPAGGWHALEEVQRFREFESKSADGA